MPRKSIEQRIAERVERRSPEECWPINGYLNKQGYGKINVNGRQTCVHRVVYQLIHGSIDLETVVRHTCDNPSCGNPAHLIPGTVQDNVDDRNSRNRQARGERSGRAKLTADQVRDIRNKYVPRKVTYKSIALEYGITLDQAHRIVRGKSWSHL